MNKLAKGVLSLASFSLIGAAASAVGHLGGYVLATVALDVNGGDEWTVFPPEGGTPLTNDSVVAAAEVCCWVLFAIVLVLLLFSTYKWIAAPAWAVGWLTVNPAMHSVISRFEPSAVSHACAITFLAVVALGFIVGKFCYLFKRMTPRDQDA